MTWQHDLGNAHRAWVDDHAERRRDWFEAADHERADEDYCTAWVDLEADAVAEADWFDRARPILDRPKLGPIRRCIGASNGGPSSASCC
jgi:hypothetical protein